MPSSTVHVPCIAACHAAQSLASDAQRSEACAPGHKPQSSDKSQGTKQRQVTTQNAVKHVQQGTMHTAAISHITKRSEACEPRHSQQVGQSSSTPGWDWRDRRGLPDIPSGRITPKGGDGSHSPLLDIPPEGMGGWIKQLGHGMSRVQEVTAAAMQP